MGRYSERDINKNGIDSTSNFNNGGFGKIE